MKTKQSALLATLIAAAVLGGCASDKPASTTTAASTQSATTAQSTTNSASTNPASSTSTVRTNNAAVMPTGAAVYFDYDSYSVKDQYGNVVRSNADYMTRAVERLELDGNADERGSREYNMALGQKRADAVKRALTALGAKGERIETISFGEDKPKATGNNEAAWAENRRVDFVLKK
ncbi:MAG: OmpA family protein [Betaproteobacteria bacterium]